MAMKLNDALIEIRTFRTAFIPNLSCIDKWFVIKASYECDKSIYTHFIFNISLLDSFESNCWM